MPSLKQDTVPVSCPRCGFSQPEPRSAYSTVCKNCRQHFRVQEALRPAAKAAAIIIEQRRVRCFQCGTELEAPKAAASTMCKRCSGYVDLSDYRINATISKNFCTHGWLVVEEKGYVLNTEARVGEAVIKGRLIGKLAAENTLEIHTSANIKGTLTAGRLVIPVGERFRWGEPLRLGGAEVGGELVADLCSTGTVLLKATARYFGTIESLHLVVEPGAVFVGSARIGQAPAPAKPVAAASMPAAPAETIETTAEPPKPAPARTIPSSRARARARATALRRTTRVKGDNLPPDDVPSGR